MISQTTLLGAAGSAFGGGGSIPDREAGQLL